MFTYCTSRPNVNFYYPSHTCMYDTCKCTLYVFTSASMPRSSSEESDICHWGTLPSLIGDLDLISFNSTTSSNAVLLGRGSDEGGFGASNFTTLCRLFCRMGSDAIDPEAIPRLGSSISIGICCSNCSALIVLSPTKGCSCCRGSDVGGGTVWTYCGSAVEREAQNDMYVYRNNIPLS